MDNWTFARVSVSPAPRSELAAVEPGFMPTMASPSSGSIVKPIFSAKNRFFALLLKNGALPAKI